ncbi:Crp/Fnr family transcriptional regulator [Parahaliea mediterranea]|uniref:Crp/Fnr family transcriptional regulator n=1 Tax=Parahaliea mediterranea TaxID=651086 RepID=A0A939IJ19_9GAMM|nr:Crp/Fnr family transcriptional regulator [Parahaliea mediterranea]MBN7797189.1 Crp/Fnr family transcriptional regulator [Parahaliea mediterranea]
MHDLGTSNNWISQLPEAVQAKVMAKGSRLNLPRGKAIYSVGEQAEATYQLLSGEVQIFAFDSEGSEVMITAIQANECFGLMSIMDGLPRSNTAVAATDIELFRLGAGDFRGLLREEGEIARSMCTLLGRRTRYLMTMLNEITLLNLQQRIARLLCRLVSSRGSIEGETAVLAEVTHELIASVLGSSRQSVGREIRSLERSGMISLHYRKIIIHDYPRFRALYYSLLTEDAQTET